MRRLIWAFVCRRCDRLKIPHWSRYWEFWLKIHLLLFFDCLNGDGYGKSRLVRSTVGSRLYDYWVRWGEKLCMCVCFFRKYADTKLLHFHNWMNDDPKLTVHCKLWILIEGGGFELCRRHCTCGSRGGTGGPDLHGISQVIWVSTGNKQLDPPLLEKVEPPPPPLENVGPPLESWKMIDFFEIDQAEDKKKWIKKNVVRA